MSYSSKTLTCITYPGCVVSLTLVVRSPMSFKIACIRRKFCHG